MIEPVRVSAIHSEFHLKYIFGFRFLISLSKYVLVVFIHNLYVLLLSPEAIQNFTVILTGCLQKQF